MNRRGRVNISDRVMVPTTWELLARDVDEADGPNPRAWGSAKALARLVLEGRRQ